MHHVPQTSRPRQSKGLPLSVQNDSEAHNTSLSNVGHVAEELRLKVESSNRPYAPALARRISWPKVLPPCKTHPPPKEINPASFKAKYWFFPVQRNVLASECPESSLKRKLRVAFNFALINTQASSLRFTVTIVRAFSFCDGLVHIGAKNIVH